MAKHRTHKINFIALTLVSFIILVSLSFKTPVTNAENDNYKGLYNSRINAFANTQKKLVEFIQAENIFIASGVNNIKNKIAAARKQMKAIDLWLRYLEPTAYHKINGPLAVEWETEVFEKFERPYKREGAGLGLAELYLAEKNIHKDSLISLINASIKVTDIYLADSITKNLNSYHHFYLANRLFLLNLAAIYTTGFECPDPDNIIPELGYMLESVAEIYSAYDQSFPDYVIKKEYLDLYQQAILFVKGQPIDPNKFDHYSFIKNYVNPLFSLNQKMIRDYRVVSVNFNDYSLEDNSFSIFDKALYKGQNEKGVFLQVDDPSTLNEIRQIGKLLFYDPILSGNTKRSCASCHRSGEYFTDTTRATSFQFDNQQTLPRNTVSLINVVYNHLVMLDGRHTSLLNQAKDVVTNTIEMGGNDNDIVKNVMSCREYKKAFNRFVKLTPNSKKISLDHIVSAVILYYSSFSKYYAPFDDAMNEQKPLVQNAITGFNIFMSKAQCGTCHFVPQFNGVRPPYISTEFEVLGIPADTFYRKISPDSGRALINPAAEMMNAFRTGTVRNAAHTKPYMHNGVFKTLEEVIDFYDAGGGTGKGLKIKNQTLSTDSLKLTKIEKEQLLAFIYSLNENIQFDEPPAKLPASGNKNINNRKVGGEF